MWGFCNTSKKIQIDKTFQVFSQFASSMGGKRKGKGKGKGKGLAFQRGDLCVLGRGLRPTLTCLCRSECCLGYRFSKEKKATWRRCAKSRVWTTGSLAKGLQNPTCPMPLAIAGCLAICIRYVYLFTFSTSCHGWDDFWKVWLYPVVSGDHANGCNFTTLLMSLSSDQLPTGFTWL